MKHYKKESNKLYTIAITESTWKKLHHIKFEHQIKTLDKVIWELLIIYEESRPKD